MRLVMVALSAGFLAQCASGASESAPTGEAATSTIVIGVAETSRQRDPRYALLWRRLGEDGRFLEYDDARSFEARTHAPDSIRIDGIPGEFEVFRVAPGVYALDSVFATLRERGVRYFAQGVVRGAQRPAFEVSAGETAYLGIWELDIDGAEAVARLWRLDEADAEAAWRASRGAITSPPTIRAAPAREAPCAPQRMSNMSERLIC